MRRRGFTTLLVFITFILLFTTEETDSQNPSSTLSPSSPPPPSTPPKTWDSAVRSYGWVLALIILASLGIISVISIQLYVLIKILVYPSSVSSKPWRTHWLGQTLLVGIFCSYATLFAFLPYSSPATCAIIRFCVGTSYALCFSVLFVKLVTVLGTRYGELSFCLQMTLFFFVWAVQIVIDTQWLIERRPSVMSRDDVINEPWGACEPGYAAHVQSLVYVMFLIVTCVLVAIATHNISVNHYEGVYIGIAAAGTVPIWIVWILLGFLINDSRYHDPCIAFGLLITATWLLVIMFVPKIYYLNSVDRRRDTYTDAYGPSVYPGSSLTELYPGSRQGNLRTSADSLHRDHNVVLGYEPALRFSGEGMDSGERAGAAGNGKAVREKDVRTIPYDYDPNAMYLRHPGAPLYNTRMQGSEMTSSRKPRDGNYDVTFANPHAAMTLNGVGRPYVVGGEVGRPYMVGGGEVRRADSAYYPDRPTAASRSNAVTSSQSYIARAWSDQTGLT